MNKSLLLGLWKHMVRIPRPIWQRMVSRSARSNQAYLNFMGEDHHKIRDFVVLELPKTGVPLSPEWIASHVNLPLERTLEILDELEKHMTFLFRNEKGGVVWAYPVTVEPTPHHITLQTGEQVYAA